MAYPTHNFTYTPFVPSTALVASPFLFFSTAIRRRSARYTHAANEWEKVHTRGSIKPGQPLSMVVLCCHHRGLPAPLAVGCEAGYPPCHATVDALGAGQLAYTGLGRWAEGGLPALAERRRLFAGGLPAPGPEKRP
jgi:hypothetical protein